jgi:hypothetical protein
METCRFKEEAVRHRGIEINSTGGYKQIQNE